MNKALLDKVLALGPRGRTVDEMAAETKESAKDIRDLLEGKPQLPDGRQLVHWMDSLGMRSYELLMPEPPLPTTAPRAFRSIVAPNGQAYQRIFIPDDLKDEDGKPAKYIRLKPLSDVHWGHEKCDRKNFLRDVKEIARVPNLYTYWNGDMMDNSLGTSAGGAAWAEQKDPPNVQREQLEKVLRPIAHKTFHGRPGNHEWRSWLHALMDPLKEIAHSLNVQYFPGPANMEIVWKGYRWSFYTFHGTGSSNTPGGKATVAAKPRQYNDFRNFFIMGHVHDELVMKVTRSLRLREFDGQKLKRFWTENRKEYVIICPAYLLYDSTYAEQAGYSPGSRNTIDIQLYANGDYHVVSSMRSLETGDVIAEKIE